MAQVTGSVTLQVCTELADVCATSYGHVCSANIHPKPSLLSFQSPDIFLFALQSMSQTRESHNWHGESVTQSSPWTHELHTSVRVCLLQDAEWVSPQKRQYKEFTQVSGKCLLAERMPFQNVSLPVKRLEQQSVHRFNLKSLFPCPKVFSRLLVWTK